MRALRKPPRLGSGSDGFTLIEMLAVLAILAAVVAIAMPGVLRRPEPKLEITVAEVAAEMRALRAQAIGGGHAVALTLDAAAGVLRSDASARTIGLGAGTLATLSGARGGSGGAGILFFPDGSSTGGQLVLSRAGERAVVAVSWLTGAVDVETGR